MAKPKVARGWRTAAIILGVIVLLMLGIFVYGFMIAGSEQTCANYCYDEKYESFAYDYANDVCNCYLGTSVVDSVHVR